MYLAPLNYDRFFKRVFGDTKIAKRFLEDFLFSPLVSFSFISGFLFISFTLLII